jgi:O-methyltransferase
MGQYLKLTSDGLNYIFDPNIKDFYIDPNLDKEFVEVYQKMGHQTMIDDSGCYLLWHLIRETANLENGAILEVGTFKGGSGSLISKSARQHGINNKIYLCDTFSGTVKAGEKDNYFKDGELSQPSIDLVRNLLSDFKLNDVEVIKGIFPEESCDKVKDDKFRFCHIDVDIYQSAKDTLDWVWPKMVQGGIVLFDDYNCHNCAGITSLVNEELTNDDRFFYTSPQILNLYKIRAGAEIGALFIKK